MKFPDRRETRPGPLLISKSLDGMCWSMRILNNKGQSLIEFVLLLPVLLLILMSIIEFGMMLNAYMGITHASREGARLGAIGASTTEITTEVIDNLPILDPSRVSVIVTPSTRLHGQDVDVAITYNYQIMMPLMGAVVGDAIELHAQTVMRIE